jgi:hypothetical protein
MKKKRALLKDQHVIRNKDFKPQITTTLKQALSATDSLPAVDVYKYKKRLVNYIASQFINVKFNVKRSSKTSLKAQRMAERILIERPNPWETTSAFWARAIKNIIMFDWIGIIEHEGNYYICDRPTTVDGYTWTGTFHIPWNGNFGGQSITKQVELQDIFILRNPNWRQWDDGNDALDVLGKGYSAVSDKMDQSGSIKVLIGSRIDANLASNQAAMENKAKAIVDVGSNNKGVSFIDQDDKVVQLQPDYTGTATDELTYFKDDVLGSFSLSENLLSGDYTHKEFISFLTTQLYPMVDIIIEEIADKLEMSVRDITYSYDYLRALDPETFMTFTDKLIYNGVVSANEIRSQLGYDTIEGLDEIFTNANAIQVTERGGEGVEETVDATTGEVTDENIAPHEG